MIKEWFLAARPKTLLVGVAPVLAGSALAYAFGKFNWIPALICLVFALLAQITSNFVNDYYDFKKGTDREDRLGPERAVATGKISAKAMWRATLITISLALLVGLSLIYYGGWWLIGVGALVAVFAFAYSGGPYPLSYHGLGDIAVLIFYGIVPVVFTYYVQAHDFPVDVWLASIGVGLVGVNVLIVNNYRDMETDAVSGKRTTVVIFGRERMALVYLVNCILAYNLGYAVIGYTSFLWIAISFPFVIFSVMLWFKLQSLRGKALNKVLGMTALNVLLFAVCLSIGLIISK
ncbi:MAG: 1,4-dihydroxy-2-naphthoate polyprenyltransferase [Bacteroidales bacterium]